MLFHLMFVICGVIIAVDGKGQKSEDEELTGICIAAVGIIMLAGRVAGCW